MVCKFTVKNNIMIFYNVAARSTTAHRGCSEGRKLSKRSDCRIRFNDKRKTYTYHNSVTGRTDPQLSSQNVAGFSNISDFPSNSYNLKL